MTSAHQDGRDGEDRLTQHHGDEDGNDWNVEATDPRPTGAGAGETPEEGRGGEGTTRSTSSEESPKQDG